MVGAAAEADWGGAAGRGPELSFSTRRHSYQRPQGLCSTLIRPVGLPHRGNVNKVQQPPAGAAIFWCGVVVGSVGGGGGGGPLYSHLYLYKRATM